MTPLASYDLHLHTYWSYDATAAPEEHFRRARELSVCCLAVTEHHHLDSWDEVREVAAAYPEIRLLRAAELTVTCSIGSVDLVCLGFPDELPPRVVEVIEAYHQWQRDYGSAVSRGMVALGYGYGDDARLALLRSYRPEKTLRLQGNTHVRNGAQRDHFLAQGWIADADGYGGLMGRVGEAAQLPPYPAAELVIPAVKEAGALVAIAHPVGYFQRDNRQRMDQLREELDLDGIECAHPGVPPELTQSYRAYCREHGLLSTAGSDAHNASDLNRLFARHGGDEAWLDELLGRLDGRA
jgi:predicted metal-dependent phosphoesterase TrpH